MRPRNVVLLVLVLGVIAVGTFGARGASAAVQQWAVVDFSQPTWIADRVVMGTVLIVHDDDKMTRGEPCTYVYRFDRETGPQEQVVAFMCTPALRSAPTHATLTSRLDDPRGGVRVLTEYQFQGDSEAHAVPVR